MLLLFHRPQQLHLRRTLAPGLSLGSYMFVNDSVHRNDHFLHKNKNAVYYCFIHCLIHLCIFVCSKFANPENLAMGRNSITLNVPLVIICLGFSVNKNCRATHIQGLAQSLLKHDIFQNMSVQVFKEKNIGRIVDISLHKSGLEGYPKMTLFNIN